MSYRKKLIEVALPLDAVNEACVREGYIYRQHPTVLHKWWAQRPAAACAAVLFAQLVDDPSSNPEAFPTLRLQEAERDRLFDLITQLVTWESRHDRSVLEAARLEVANSIARSNGDNAFGPDTSPAIVDRYLSTRAPWVLDPFAGGGTIPLEASRLGMPAYAQDLNPIPVLLTSALVDYPSRFMGRPPVSSAKGLAVRNPTAVDFAHYGERLIRNLKATHGGQYSHPRSQNTVLAWIWCRTVPSPDPAFAGTPVPLIGSYWLWKKAKKNTWLSPVVNGNEWDFVVKTGDPSDRKAVSNGTKVSDGVFRCLLSNSIIETEYIRKQGQQGRIGFRLLAVVSKSGSAKVFESAADFVGQQPEIISPPSDQRGPALPKKALGFRVQKYGMEFQSQLYLPRQWQFLSDASNQVAVIHDEVMAAALRSGMADDGAALESGGNGARAYADFIALLLAFSVSKMVDYHCALIGWYTKEARTSHLFTKQAVPMAWDFVENNPLANVGGSLLRNISLIQKYLEVGTSHITEATRTRVRQVSATDSLAATEPPVIVSTDPPYYDNVPYADLSDLFYYWIRRTTRPFFPSLTKTILTPKEQELIAEPARAGSPQSAEEFFLSGMESVLSLIAHRSNAAFPVTIYYAFKQSEVRKGQRVSTGWETFLDAVVRAGLQITGTWPIRTERNARTRGQGSNALATSVVLVCRKQDSNAPTTKVSRYRRMLRKELPDALKALWSAGVAPVDMAQASIGPGMAVFSRYSAVLESDDSHMSIRRALQLINEVIDEIQGEEEGELDPETRFALTWFETHGYSKGPFGQAENLAKARALSVSGVVEAGICTSGGGQVQLLARERLPDRWDPLADSRPTVWEATQHLIKTLDTHGEGEAAALLARISRHPSFGSSAESARLLAYRLYAACERRGNAEEGGAYNRLVVAWPDLVRLSADAPPPVGTQTEIF